jgi:hypothetical protein
MRPDAIHELSAVLPPEEATHMMIPFSSESPDGPTMLHRALTRCDMGHTGQCIIARWCRKFRQHKISLLVSRG